MAALTTKNVQTSIYLNIYEQSNHSIEFSRKLYDYHSSHFAQDKIIIICSSATRFSNCENTVRKNVSPFIWVTYDLGMQKW